MSKRGHLATVLGSVLLAVLGVTGSARAAHLVKVDEQTINQGAPQPSQASAQSSCLEHNGFTGQGNFIGAQVAYVDVGDFATLAGDCGTTDATLVNTGSVTISLTADPGDPAGPITLCFAARHSLAADSTGADTAAATFGGDTFPITTPATIIRSPGAVQIFSDGPTTILTGTDADSREGLFSASVGDTITLRVGAGVNVTSAGSGSADARASARLSVNIGTCIDHGAPVVSHAGLAMLAAVLGALGVLTVARRRSFHRRAAD